MLKTVDKALDVLEAFTSDKPEWGVTELGHHLGWDKSVAQRVLATLEARGYVARSARTRGYRLGLAVLGLADVVNRTLDVREASREGMAELVGRTGESALLTVVAGDEAVCVDALDGPRAIKYSTRVGMRVPPHVGAGSKVLFAFRPAEEIEAFLSGRELEAFTEGTIVDRGDLLEEYARIRARGVAFSLGELDPEVGAIGFPLRDRLGAVVAAVTVVGPKSRIVGEQARLERTLREIGGRISSGLAAGGS
ncbi:MAG: Transcriptional regulator, IclR family [uncultured Rubrobacteraceae bacterium]|uniref:Transcriptional regulator, IclR family n=1 Tax=uncultured Rubrobacteraceae bacterium TaxID=349277 RepID=A0A6J4R480_9ACTN|nr:MAG: Transcriptional regulator, IclR family [uncultured Rubrobacteraceae bacterium]